MRTLSTLAVAFACAAAAAQTTQPAPDPESRPIVRPESRPAEAATGSPEALALARKVFEFAGGRDGWAKVDNVVCTVAGGHRMFWDVNGRKVRIENLREPKPRQPGTIWRVLVFDVAADRNVLQAPEPPPRAPRLSGRSMWIDDTWRLLAPLKVLDPGVFLSLEPRAEGDVDGVRRLRLRFDGGQQALGGSSASAGPPEYVLHVEDHTGNVLQWDDQRVRTHPGGGTWKSWRSENHRRSGPLTLALRHPALAGGEGITLSDVALNVKVPKDVWTSEQPLLDRIGKD